MIKHLIILKFKPGVTEAQIAEFHTALSALPGRIPEIKEYSFGKDIMHSERSYDFALVSAFADMDALRRYNEHPDHRAVLEIARNIVEKTWAVDYEM